MKTALESYGGVKGTDACFVSIDQAAEPKVKAKMPGISVGDRSVVLSGFLHQ
jgi:hypothetical protein